MVESQETEEFALVEIMGHSRLVGRVEEVERFGTRLLKIEPIFRGELLPPIYQGGGSIYRYTPCTREVAFANSPKSPFDIPLAVRARLPETPDVPLIEYGDDEDDDPEGE